eukprot:jgi/Botrbrau1/7637/Bobra.0159s0083.2
MGSNEKKKVLFVCLGNICRSPAAEAVFQNLINQAGVSADFEVDSCGTGGGNPNWYKPGGWHYHHGNPADERMIATAAKRGIDVPSISRPLVPADFDKFDYIVAMDDDNVAAIKEAAEFWSKSFEIPKDYKSKITLMVSHLRDENLKKRYREVPDPYYGGQRGFDLVLDLLADASEGLLENIRQNSV